MDLYSSFRRINFVLVYSMILMHILQMLKFASLPSSI